MKRENTKIELDEHEFLIEGGMCDYNTQWKIILNGEDITNRVCGVIIIPSEVVYE